MAKSAKGKSRWEYTDELWILCYSSKVKMVPLKVSGNKMVNTCF